VKLQDCPEIFDTTPREAKFAIRATDLESWKSSFRTGKEPTDSDPSTIQQWALVVYFPRGEMIYPIYLFEAWIDNKFYSRKLLIKLQATRAQFGKEEIKIFEKADYIGTAETSPRQLLKIAKQVKTGKYSALFNNNCQTWLKEYLKQININCGSSLSLPDNYRIGLTN
jgi:hypothetical protein